MPAIYAHHYFGKLVYNQVKGDVKEVLRTHFKSFRLGLQGPDLFLYHGLIFSDAITARGDYMHKQPFSEFLHRAVDVVREKGMESGEFAYLLGFLCHFTLDSETHPYIDKYAENNGVSHVYMETEFDKYILKKEGLDPMKTDISYCVTNTMETAKHVASFFAEISDWKAYMLCNEMYLKRKVLYTPYDWDYKCKNFLFDYFPSIRKFRETMFLKEDHVKCHESNCYLEKKLVDSVELAISLIENLENVVKNKAPLSDRFHRNFETVD